MKNLVLPIICFAAAMSSCAKDEQSESGSVAASSTDLVSINLYAGTTRGEDLTTGDLQASTIELYIDDSDGVSDFFTFEYLNNDWIQTDDAQLKWSDIDYPASFYSLHDGDPITSVTVNNGSLTITDYTIEELVTDHKDLLYHASTLDEMPTIGALSALHSHALSKLNLYAAMGSNKLYIARVRLVNVDETGTVEITPAASSETNGSGTVAWSSNTTFDTTYEYFYIEGDSPEEYVANSDGSNPIINDETDAPMMIIPQETTEATVKASSTSGSVAEIEGSYIEVIYYLADADDEPIIGYPSISSMPLGSKYDTTDDEPLYVMAAFPLGYEFEPNNEYDINLGIGVSGSSGGKLMADYYVDKDGNMITLTLLDGTEEKPDVPGVEEGDDILADDDDLVDITVDIYGWGSGGSTTLGVN